MRSKLAIVMVALMLLAGCAGLTMTGSGYDLGSIAPAKNSQVAATTAEVKDAWGQNSRTTTLWQVQNGVWVMVNSQQASGAGIGQTATTAFVGGVPTAVALPIAAHAIRPSRTDVNQNNQGGNATQGQGQGQVGINSQAQGQLQGQAQGQLQNQHQLQQDHPVLSPGTVF